MSSKGGPVFTFSLPVAWLAPLQLRIDYQTIKQTSRHVTSLGHQGAKSFLRVVQII